MNTFKSSFFRGLKITVPILITAAIIKWLVEMIEMFFGFIIKLVIPAQYYIPGMGALFGLILIFTVGFVMNAMFISKIHDYFEKMIKRIPVVRIIYQAIQDVMGFLDQTRSSSHGATVLVEVVGPIKLLGFVTRDDLAAVGISDDSDVCVYCPMSYQMGGYTMIVSRSKIRPIDIDTQEAMSFIFTAGIAKKKRELGDHVDATRQ